MRSANLVFPHQLYAQSPLRENGHLFYLIEEELFFSQYNFHKQKIAFHRATMRSYRDRLQGHGHTVHYINAQQKESAIEVCIAELAAQGFTEIQYVDPTDDWLSSRLDRAALKHGLKTRIYPSQLFLNTPDDLTSFFRADKTRFFQTDFYIEQRKMRNILVTNDRKPAGGKWSYDAENRKKYPRKKDPPQIDYPKANGYYDEACAYVAEYFPDNIGELPERPLYPIDEAGAMQWLNLFLETRFADFGTYEDAIVADEHVLHHSVLTPMLNVGLLTPQQVINAALDAGEAHDIALNSLEGFVRQVVGWREFIRGMYEVRGREQRTTNFWGFKRPIPSSFYDATTGILPVDITIRKVLRSGYCHHIERLMVLGNFMLLCEFHPDAVYRWFMELFVDAYDWVMVPNVYGMSQFADGGLMATKPYISGSNYLMKMSDYPKGKWQAVWDGLFWRFMHVHRNFFSGNPRLAMLLGTWDRMAPEKRKRHVEKAHAFLSSLD